MAVTELAVITGISRGEKVKMDETSASEGRSGDSAESSRSMASDEDEKQSGIRKAMKRLQQ